MSIDTAAKRKSISGLVLPFLLVGVTPDATPDAAWRQSSAWSYEGIAAQAAAVGVVHEICLCDSLTFRIPASPSLRLAIEASPNVTLRIPSTPTLRLEC